MRGRGGGFQREISTLVSPRELPLFWASPPPEESSPRCSWCLNPSTRPALRGGSLEARSWPSRHSATPMFRWGGRRPPPTSVRITVPSQESTPSSPSGRPFVHTGLSHPPVCSSSSPSRTLNCCHRRCENSRFPQALGLSPLKAFRCKEP